MYELSEAKIFELLQEDDHGLWELAWALGIKTATDPKLAQFGKLISALVRSHQVLALQKNKSTGMLEAIELRDSRLASELVAIDRPNPEAGYWFRLVKSGDDPNGRS